MAEEKKELEKQLKQVGDESIKTKTLKEKLEEDLAEMKRKCDSQELVCIYNQQNC